MKTKIKLTDKKFSKAYAGAVAGLMCDDDFDADHKLTIFLVSNIIFNELHTALFDDDEED